MKTFRHSILGALFLSATVSALELRSVGGYEYHDSNGSHKTVTDIIQENKLDGINAVSMWLTPEWDKSWYPADEVNTKIVKQGYTPLFILYWFADNISLKYIQKNKVAYMNYLKRVRQFLDTIEGKKIIVLNPEYNEHGVEGWDGYNDLLLESKQILDKGDIRIGPCVGDFGNYSKTADYRNWESFDPSLRRAIESFDFIAFQEMRSLTKNKANEIENLPERIEAFSHYLNKKYEKPVLLAYLALSSWGEGGENLQANVIQKLGENRESLEKNGLIGINFFHLSDVPSHIGYFEEGEKHFGLLHSDLSHKPAMKFINTLTSP